MAFSRVVKGAGKIKRVVLEVSDERTWHGIQIISAKFFKW